MVMPLAQNIKKNFKTKEILVFFVVSNFFGRLWLLFVSIS